MKKIAVLFILLSTKLVTSGQRPNADSLEARLAVEKTDTGKVKLLYGMADIISVYDPAKALLLSQQSLNLATHIHYVEGQSKALGSSANTFLRLGNYPKALELNLQKLKLEENRNVPRNLAFALLNTGIVYRYQEDYQQALRYYYRADSVFRQNELTDLRYFSLMNLGDAYDKMGNTDSAFSYFNQALIISNNLKDPDHIGNAQTGLGHTYLKQGNYAYALLNYQTAISNLELANNEEVLCEATLGLAKLFDQQHRSDSAAHYASFSLRIAEKDSFMTSQLEAARFLSALYKKTNNTDSAYFYLVKVQQLNDSLNSKSKIRELQAISSNEQLRQMEIEENKKLAERERKQQLQFLFIGMFIPGFFLLTLLLSRIRIHTRVIRILGILSLLILFEYLTLLLHPTVVAFTNHTPFYEMIIFVAIAALLIPAHHRIEKWLIAKLTHQQDESIRLKKVKLTVKKPS